MESGWVVLDTVAEHYNGQMGHNMKERGALVALRAMESSLTPRGKFMKANGGMTKLTATVFTFTVMEPSMKEAGSRTFSMEQALRVGRIHPGLRANT